MGKRIRMEDLPTYEITIDDDSNQGIRLVSLVTDPAIEEKGMCFNKLEEYKFKSIKDKQMVVGPAMIPDKKIIREDKNGNLYYVVFRPETILKMVEKFNKENNNNAINIDHTDKMAPAFIQQQWIVEDPMYDKSKMYGYSLPIGSWFIEVKVEDEKFWQDEVKNAERFSFSIEGYMNDDKLIEMSTNDVIDTLTEEELFSLFNELLPSLQKG